MKRIRTVIVEDDIKISELHKRFTEKVEGFEVIGIANSLPDGEEMVDVLEPELVLLDLFFPEGRQKRWARCRKLSAAEHLTIL